MKKRTVIKNLPVRFPVGSTILYIFLLDYYNVDNLWWGIFITVFSIIWIGLIVAKCAEEKIDLDDVITDGKSANKFTDKLNELIKKNSKTDQ